MMDRKVVLGAIVLSAGRGGSQVLGVLSTLIAARLLTPEDFGLIAMAMAVFSIAAAFTEIPVASALMRMREISRADIDTAWTINVLRGACASLIMALAAAPLASATKDPRLFWLTLALAAYPFILGLRNSAFEQHARALDFRFEALTEFGTRLVAFTLAATLAFLTGSYWALPLSLIGSGLTAVALSFLLKPWRPRFDLSRTASFLHFSVWMSLAHIADSLRMASLTLFIGKTVSTETAGGLSIATRFSDQIEFLLVAPLERSLYAAFSAIQGDVEALQRLYHSALRVSSTLILPACIGASLLADRLTLVLLGQEWTMAGEALMITALMAAIYALGAPALALATARGDVRWVALAQAVACLIQAPLMFALTWLYGLSGGLLAALGGALAWLLASLIYPVLRIGAGARAQFAACARPILASGVMAIVVLLANASRPPASGSPAGDLLAIAELSAAGAAAYTSVLLLLWAAVGRPEGPEKAIIGGLRRLLSRQVALRPRES